MVVAQKSTKSTGIFPLLPMCAVALSSFMDSFCYQIIVPNLPFAVQKWFPTIDETEVGYYYGYIISSYSLGGIFGSFFWGWFADSFGRRSSVITCLSLQMVLALVFGLAPNYYLAICIRALWGFCNGNAGVLKTYVSEVCSEDKQSLGFSVLVTMFGLSNAVGPSLGGFLGDAETYFPSLIKSFPKLRELPLFLPSATGSLLSVIVLICVIFMFPESLTKEMREENKKERIKSKERYDAIKLKMKMNKDYVPSIEDQYIIKLNENSYLQLICQKDIFWSCFIYGFYTLVPSGHDAIYPVWLILDPKHRGFSFSSSDLGWLYTGLSPIQIFASPLIFPLLGILLKAKGVSYMSGLAYATLILICPLAAYANTQSVPIQWLTILLTYGIAQCFRLFFITNTMVFVTNSTFQDFRAKVNALGQVLAATFRFIGPSVASNIFAWSISHDYPYPFDYNLAFYVFSFFMFVTTGLTYILPDSINYRKPTLREFAQAEQAKLEQASIELVEMKRMEETKEPSTQLSPMKNDKEVVIDSEVMPVVKNSDSLKTEDTPIVVEVSEKSSEKTVTI